MWTLRHNYFDPSSFGKSQIEESIKSLKSRDDLGFLKFVSRTDLIESLNQRVEEVKAGYDTLAVVGLGGSSLGAKAFLNLNHLVDHRHQVVFFDNSDPQGFHAKWESLNSHKRTHWLIISKSGSTVEVLSQFDLISSLLRDQSDLDIKEHCTVVTQFDQNQLHRWALENSVPCLEIPEDLGGRYSFFSASGLFPVLFRTDSLEKIQNGYNWAMKDSDVLSALVESSMRALESSCSVSQLWFYRDGTEYFGDWWTQLWAESLGKRLKLDGTEAPSVTSPSFCRGASAQHSVLQQVYEGQKDKHLIFISASQNENGSSPAFAKNLSSGFLNADQTLEDLLQAQMVGTIESLWDIDVPSIGLVTPDLDVESSSALFMLSMLWVASLGECLGINAFDQPGVEVGKQKTRQILKA